MSDDARRQDPCGFLNVHKPPGCTSRDVVNQIQRFTGRKVRIGHAGTLDPMASGVLLICLGRATKLVPLVHEFPKTYEAGFTLGQTSNTDDSTGAVTRTENCRTPEAGEIDAALQGQTGVVWQTPPAFSAVKLNGQRAYKAARQGQAVAIKPRPVTIHSIEVLEYRFPRISLRICCGSGTYIRSIARDVGEALGVGGLMSGLVRTAIGPFQLPDAVAVDPFNDDWTSLVRPVMTLFDDWPRHVLDQTEIRLLRDGKRLLSNAAPDRLVAVDDQGRFAAILQREQGSSFRATLNWVPSWFQ